MSGQARLSVGRDISTKYRVSSAIPETMQEEDEGQSTTTLLLPRHTSGLSQRSNDSLLHALQTGRKASVEERDRRVSIGTTESLTSTGEKNNMTSSKDMLSHLYTLLLPQLTSSYRPTVEICPDATAENNLAFIHAMRCRVSAIHTPPPNMTSPKKDKRDRDKPVKK